jgi:hypothetical protein
MEEIGAFADTASRIEAGLEVEQSALVAAARLLGLAGHPVQNALSPKHGLKIAADLIRVASGGNRQAGSDLPWAGIGRPLDFFRELASSSHPATRVVEQLASGGLGAEVVDKLWEAVTKTADPGVSRRALLHFLYLNRLHPQIVRLAATCCHL